MRWWLIRPRGAGRPTKAERRDLVRLRGDLDFDYGIIIRPKVVFSRSGMWLFGSHVGAGGADWWLTDWLRVLGAPRGLPTLLRRRPWASEPSSPLLALFLRHEPAFRLPSHRFPICRRSPKELRVWPTLCKEACQ